jgi:glucose-6-phosphate 1-dehydrogenase
VNFERALGARQEAYERLLGDALQGNPARFAGRTAWNTPGASFSRCSTTPARSITTGPVPEGPPHAEAVVTGHQGWHNPTP